MVRGDPVFGLGWEEKPFKNKAFIRQNLADYPVRGVRGVQDKDSHVGRGIAAVQPSRGLSLG